MQIVFILKNIVLDISCFIFMKDLLKKMDELGNEVTEIQ